MSHMSGIVEQVSTKDVTTKFGTKPTYSFKVNGVWVKHGFKNPYVNVGDEVEFDGESGSYGVETKSVRVTSKGAAGAVAVPSSAAPKASGGGGSFNSRVFPIPALHGDRSIVRQNALARATELYIGARGNKPFELDSDTTNIIILVARQFEAYTAGDLDLAEATKEVAESA